MSSPFKNYIPEHDDTVGTVIMLLLMAVLIASLAFLTLIMPL